MSQYAYTVLIEEDEDRMLVASVPSIKGCSTQAKTMPELLKRIEKVIQLCLKAEESHIKPLKFVGLQEIRIAG